MSSSPFEAVSDDGTIIVGTRWAADGALPPVVMLHGGGQTRRTWFRSAKRLQSAGAEVLSYDARGHGESGWSSTGDYSLDAHLRDLKAVVALLPDRPYLIGASMGGLTALLAAGEGSVPAAGLILVDVAPRIEPAGAERVLSFLAGNVDGFADLDEVYEALHAYRSDRASQERSSGIRHNLRWGEGGRLYWHWDPAFLDFNREPLVEPGRTRISTAAAQVSIPTLVVRGTRSDILSEQGVQDLLEMIPHAELARADAGHMVAGDDNDTFTASVVPFLRQHTPDPARHSDSA